ncbi:hypothetical protein ACFPRL_34525 [Pseudoclavibacter helvolus]
MRSSHRRASAFRTKYREVSQHRRTSLSTPHHETASNSAPRAARRRPHDCTRSHCRAGLRPPCRTHPRQHRTHIRHLHLGHQRARDRLHPTATSRSPRLRTHSKRITTSCSRDPLGSNNGVTHQPICRESGLLNE